MKHLFIFLVMVFGISIGAAQQTGYYYNLVSYDILFFSDKTDEIRDITNSLDYQLVFQATRDGVTIYKQKTQVVFGIDGYLIVPLTNDASIYKFLGLVPSQFIDNCPFMSEDMKEYLLDVERQVNENIAKRLNGGA